MLTVTENAKKYCARILNDGGAPPEIVIRLHVREQALAVTPDQARDGDESFEHEGKTVFVVETALAEHLDERTLDVEETEEGPRLKME